MTKSAAPASQTQPTHDLISRHTVHPPDFVARCFAPSARRLENAREALELKVTFPGLVIRQGAIGQFDTPA